MHRRCKLGADGEIKFLHFTHACDEWLVCRLAFSPLSTASIDYALFPSVSQPDWWNDHQLSRQPLVFLGFADGVSKFAPFPWTMNSSRAKLWSWRRFQNEKKITAVSKTIDEMRLGQFTHVYDDWFVCLFTFNLIFTMSIANDLF